MNDSRSRALLTTALHPSSTPNERLMALAAFNRVMERAGLHASDIAIYDASAGPARSPAEADRTRDIALLRAEVDTLGRRIKAQEKALRQATREMTEAARTLAGRDAAIARLEAAAGADACQIAALEADLAARDRIIAGKGEKA